MLSLAYALYSAHPLPAGIVGLILVLRLYLFRNAVEHFI